jgi:hypothetical protein
MRKLSLVLLLFALVFSAAADITLVKDGKTDYVIVLPEKPIPEEVDAVNDMKEILKKSTGADFKIVSPAEADKQTKRIFIGFSSPMEKLAGTIKPLENEARVYKNIGDDIFIYGGGKCGTTFSIYQFLMDTIGFRALHFWGDVIIPEHKTLELKDFSYDKIPSYLYRDILQAQWNIAGCPTSLLAFRRMQMHSNQFDSLNRMTNCHTFSEFIPYGYELNQRGMPLAIFKDKAYFKTNPDFFGVDTNGKPSDRMALCFSNPELRKTMTENVELFLKSRKVKPDENIVVDIAQDDIGGKFCHCAGCAKFEAQYKAPCGAFYDYLIHDASPHFAKNYPNMLIRVLAYGGKEQTETPPAASALKDGKLPSNLTPFLAYISGDYSKAWTDPANREIYDKLSAWGEISEKMFVYYYPTTYARPLVSIHMFGNVLRTANDYKTGAKLNIRYLFNDYQTNFFQINAGFYGLQHYLMARLSNDASLDIDMLVKEYTDAIYGAAGKMMRDYFYDLEKLGQQDSGFLQWSTDPRFANYLTPANIMRWQKQYDQMERMVEKDENALAHLRCSRINIDLMTMLLWNEIKQSGIKLDTNPDIIFQRFMDSAQYAIKKGYYVDYPNGIAKKDKELAKKLFAEDRLIGTGRYFYRIAKGGKKLPEEFAGISEQNIRYVIPAANKDMITFEDSGAFRVTLVGMAPKRGAVGFSLTDPTKKYPDISLNVKVENNEPYQFYYLGRSKLTRQSQFTAPPMPYRTHKMIGGIAGFARAYCGHLYEEKNPEQEWDVYVSCSFKDERCYTDRFVLVKVQNPKDKPVILNHVEKVPPPALIADVVADADGNPEKIAWEKIRPLTVWRECLSGKDSASSPELKLVFDSKCLYLHYTEKECEPKADKDLSKNRAELIFYGDTLYPLLQIAIAQDGRITCNTYSIMKSTNDMADNVVSEPLACPAKISSSCKDGVWSWAAVFPLDKLPSFKNGSLNANFYRMSSDNRSVLAWSPLYSDEYYSDLGRFGKIYPGRIVISGSEINCKQRTADGTAFMDGNRGWEIAAYPPKGIDPNFKYRIYAELRSDAEPASEQFSTRVGTYDSVTKKITGYVGIQLERIRGEEFVKIPLDRPVNLTPETYIYIGGFVPSAKYKGNVYVRSFQIEKDE